jgi:glycosyltransferase involved in cell wall biosynthesis
VIDGHSTDKTVEMARALRPDIRILVQEGRGKGAALRTGITAATGDIIVMLDADGSTDPAEIPAFVGALLAGADYAKGSRFIQGAATVDMPAIRKAANWFLVKLSNFLFGTHFTDITYGYNAIWREHVHALALEINGWEHEIIGNIRAARSGLRVVEVASLERSRFAGRAKLRAMQAGWVILLAILREPFQKPATISGLRDLQALLPGTVPLRRPVPLLERTNTVDGWSSPNTEKGATEVRQGVRGN